MIDSETKSSRDSAPWGLVLVGVLLSFSLSFSLTGNIAIQLTLEYLMPISGVWLGYYYRWKATGPMLAMGGLAIIGVSYTIDSLTIGVGCSGGTYLLSLVCFVIAALQSGAAFNGALWRHPKWNLVLSVAVFSLALGVFTQSLDSNGSSITFETYHCLGVFICLASLSYLLAAQHNRRLIVLLVIVGVATLLGSVIPFQQVQIDSVLVRFGLFRPHHLLFALCFALAIVDALNWRFLCAALASMFVVAFTITGQWSSIGDFFPLVVIADGELQWAPFSRQSSNAWAMLQYAICAVLLGAALQPFRLSLILDKSHLARFLGATLVIQFFIPGGLGQLLIASCVAFIMALTWNIRGLIAGPFIISLCAIISYGFSLDPHGMRDLSEFAIVFPAAFLGVLIARQLTTQSFGFRGKPLSSPISGVKS